VTRSAVKKEECVRLRREGKRKGSGRETDLLSAKVSAGKKKGEKRRSSATTPRERGEKERTTGIRIDRRPVVALQKEGEG